MARREREREAHTHTHTECKLYYIILYIMLHYTVLEYGMVFIMIHKPPCRLQNRRSATDCYMKIVHDRSGACTRGPD